VNIPYTSNPARNTMFIYPPSQMHEIGGCKTSHAQNVVFVILLSVVVIVVALMIRFGVGRK
jgi:hypothetical protein